jgi:hypothetical protein
LININKTKEEYQRAYAAARLALFSCSAVDNPVQWGVLCDDVTKKAIKLQAISDKLAMLKGNSIFHFHNLNLFFIDVHVNQFGNQLPYRKSIR